METALSTISLLPETRAQQKLFVHKAIEEIANGSYDPVRLFAKLRIIADTIKEITDSETFKRMAIEEAKKYNGDCNIAGNKITVATKKTFDFSTSQHTDWEFWNSQVEDAKGHLKEIEILLKALKEPVANPKTGELIYPPAFIETEYITVK